MLSSRGTAGSYTHLYAIDRRAMSQGRGSYTLKFVRYEEVPQMNQAKIIEDAKKEEEEA